MKILKFGYQRWLEEGNRLYCPGDMLTLLISLCFSATFTVTTMIVRHEYSALAPAGAIAFLIAAWLCWELYRNGLKGKPRVVITEDLVWVDKRLYQGPGGGHLEVKLLPGDQVHVVGPEKARFIRLEHPTGKREIRLYGLYQQRAMAFILGLLRQRFSVIEHEPPGFMSEVRGDY
ncbi:MAG: hypothetical protein Q7T36_05155 [Fluviicoccus sp.]|nr:hypothetical protein [Fluviicoccus sp.]